MFLSELPISFQGVRQEDNSDGGSARVGQEGWADTDGRRWGGVKGGASLREGAEQQWRGREVGLQSSEAKTPEKIRSPPEMGV